MKLYRQRFVSMGCPCEIGVYTYDAEGAQQAISFARNEVHRLDRKYSHFRLDSFITRLQEAARQPGGVDVDVETSGLLEYGATQFRLSDGLFDLTAGSLARLWYNREQLPSDARLGEALRSTGWRKIHWKSPNLSIPKGVQLELGGVVKEYAADRAAMILKRKGIYSAFVELGGDIHVTGSHPDGKPWKMGICNPDPIQRNTAEAIASIPVHRGGLATSGDYERSCMINGKRYGHIINPKTGWPVESFTGVSVHAPSCLLAGSLSTMAMLKGEQGGLEMLKNSGLAWLVQRQDGTRPNH